MGLFIFSLIALSLLVGAVASSQGRSFEKYFVLSLFFSPVIGFIVLAIKGKKNKEEILDEEPHIFYCSSCGGTYGGMSDVDAVCPDCHAELKETVILRKDWRSYSDEKKSQMKSMFAKNQYLRNISVSNDRLQNISCADEIKKYKELLDMGAITQEEYEVKKKELLRY